MHQVLRLKPSQFFDDPQGFFQPLLFTVQIGQYRAARNVARVEFGGPPQVLLGNVRLPVRPVHPRRHRQDSRCERGTMRSSAICSLPLRFALSSDFLSRASSA